MYYIKESCKEIQKGDKQSKITENDLNHAKRCRKVIKKLVMKNIKNTLQQ